MATGTGSVPGTPVVGVPFARVAAVVVSHNRRDLLLACLQALASQTRRPDVVVVVDNASSDGSPDAVRAGHPDVDLLELARNTGGAGGFAAGLAWSVERHGADAVWLMDDDTVPSASALEELLSCHERAGARAAVVASTVRWVDGRRHPMNTPRPKPGAGRAERAVAAGAGALPVRSASFVSVLVDGRRVREVGLPVADYFIWNDDFEYSTRLLRGHLGLLSGRSEVEHRTAAFGDTAADPGARFRFEVRNKIWLFTRSRSLAPAEKAVYLASTLRRWALTLRRSRSRRVLLGAAARGVAEGLRAGPRPTREVLAGLGPVSDAVAALEGRPG